MKKIAHSLLSSVGKALTLACSGGLLLLSSQVNAAVTLEKEKKITNDGLYFDGSKVAGNASNSGPGQYDYYFGPKINATGDSVKIYGDYVFVTWYRGGKYNRHVMLTRYNTKTGTTKSIEFPHTHTGYLNQWWIGESHNNIAIGISPIDGTIHLLYDMHAYSADKPSDGSLSDDYFRYSYSKDNAATVSDADFNLSQFVTNSDGGYKHLTMTGQLDYAEFSGLTYPKFFVNDQDELLMYIREGGNNNGAYKFTKYLASQNKWGNFTQFNVLDAKSHGMDYNWGVYGNMKYVDGKVRVGFQRRSSNNNDKYKYQNGFYYAYSDHQDGLNSWKNHQGQGFSLPLIDADFIKISEPGNLINETGANQVHIVGGFDWTVTDNGDVHFIGAVKNIANTENVKVHTYKKAGNSNFTTTTNFPGASRLYSYGDSIYIVGLENGRPFVEKAPGGTNNFTRIYQATSGKTYSHGVVKIEQGKIYYYLQEQVSGDKRPLYVQIIDLDLNQASQVDFQSGDVVLNEGYNALSFDVLATSANASISNVQLFVDDVLLRQENVAPYEWGHAGKPNELLGLSVGQHTLRAVATDSNGNQGEASITVTVNAIPVTIEMVDAEQSPNVAANLLDGDKNDDSRWSAQGFPKSVMFDLGIGKTITGTKMWTYLDRAYQYRIEVSQYKGSGFTTVANKQGNTSTGQPLTTSFNATGRYVKLVVTGAHNYSGDWVSINEVEIITE
ncbi:hypothetical protein C2869_02945 [Saccharobesus litoralis]|uniref:F5/8 type C domain-containing protein n=1 Tax=Saccharobesus litoralis TaxID=2172099 RepID=A0A2S0VMM9_9ALTE|nr:BNR-4 repeat-containing protein [Saccharobesus litoralis]AWB65455.1 hypothetical protein C2869_02945 [Saccharobesus litoralis]